jgi:hypothetical protein
MRNYLFLEGPEGIIAENVLENGLRLTDIVTHVLFIKFSFDGFISHCHSREACPRPDRERESSFSKWLNIPEFPPEPVLKDTNRGR